MWHGSLRKEWRPREAVKPEHCYARSDEECTSVHKHGRSKGKENDKSSELGVTAGPVCLAFYWFCLVLLPSGYMEGRSQEGFMISFWGDRQGEREGQDDLIASAIFSDSFSLKCSVFQGALLGATCPKVHHSIIRSKEFKAEIIPP